MEGDDFFAFLRRGARSPWLAEADAQNQVVLRAAAAAAGRFATGGLATVYDGVVGPWSVPTFLAASGLDAFDYALVLPPLDLCLQRVAERRHHGFDDPAATAHMHREFAAATVDRRHLIRGIGKPVEVADAIEAARAGAQLRVPRRIA